KPLTEDALLLYNSLMKRMLRVLHNVLHFMKNPYLHNDLQRFSSLLYQLVELFKVPGSDAATQADDGGRDHTLHNRIKEDMHLAANTEGPKLPQEVRCALFLLIDGFTVASPLQSVQVNTEILILLHHLNFMSYDGNSV
ncbi:hypothetical protein ATANTOWER_017866, partial [Ataeniobius toweri]|nr:hypothetical protein [Ataeniobius toweri]